MPGTEAAPDQPKPAAAKVLKINTITQILENDESEGLELDRPYQIVQLQFLPPGKDTPVTVVDAIDEGSNPYLKEGASVAIDYDAKNPRIVRLRSGSRNFPSAARRTVLIATFTFLAGLLVVALLVGLFRRLQLRGPRAMVRSEQKRGFPRSSGRPRSR
jgi:hypothetical protein